MIEFDVLIIGAGPAGSEAAFRLARQGWSVLVLEKLALDREKPCGGALAIGELLEFGEPPEEVVERRISVARIVGPDSTELDLSNENQRQPGIIVKRSLYDRWLQQRAQVEGAQFIPHAQVEALAYDGSEWRVQASCKEGSLTIKARLLLHAAGATAGAFERMLSLAPMPKQQVGVAMQHWLGVGQAKLDEVFGPRIEMHLLPDLVADGYFWLFPKRDVLVAGVGASLSMLPALPKSLMQLLDEFLARRLSELGLSPDCGRIHSDGGKIPAGLRRQMHGDGLMLLGDAAGLCSHIHGGGIFQARKSALFAAEEGSAFLNGDRAALSRYAERLRQHFFEHEARWDLKLKPLITDARILPHLVAQGKKDENLRLALGVLFATPDSHRIAFEQFERAVFPLLSSTLERITHEEREAVEAGLRELFTDGSDLSQMINASLLADAKRLRAVLVVLVGRALGASLDDLLPCALAYELTHTASLIHDDIIDHGEQRRGRPALHVQYGIGPALTAGDAMIVKSFEMLVKLAEQMPQMDLGLLVSLLRVGCNAGLSAAKGELSDIGFVPAQIEQMSVADYVQMVADKTGVLIAASTEAGALVAGADAVIVAAMRRLGLELGIAFQIFDDLKDLLTPEREGSKSSQSDIREGKLTAPFILCMQRATLEDRAWLIERLSRGTSQGYEEVLALYRRYEVIEACQQLAGERLAVAIEQLAVLPPSPEKAKLEEVLQIFHRFTLVGG